MAACHLALHARAFGNAAHGVDRREDRLLVNLGAPFLAQFLTTKGASAQFLVSSISPVEGWGFSTTAEDVLIREKLSVRIGSSNARNLLAQRFPGSSAKSEVERMRANVKRGDDDDGGVIDRIVEDMVDLFVKKAA